MIDEKVICYKFASRSRPEKFFKAIDNIFSLSKHERFFIKCSFDIDDATMNNDEVKNRLAQYPNGKLYWHYGVSRNKTEAINRDLEFTKFDVLVNMSDDMRFLVEGFDKIILADMFTNFPDGDGVVCYWDQGKETNGLMTMSIMDWLYYKRFNYIYFPGYVNVWSDNEATKVARLLGRMYYSPMNIVSHDHPANGYGQTDPQYLKTEDPVQFKIDKALFEKREANNFYITTTILSVLICTIPGREDLFNSLRKELTKQTEEYVEAVVEIISDADANKVVGEKRNDLLNRAKGKFIVFIDDDDKISSDYVSSIISAILKDPSVDCIGMNGFITTNGDDKKDWSISKDHGKWVDDVFHRWYEEDNVYYRTPNHISPVRREIAMLAMFPEKNFGEDYDYSMSILPYLKRETKINKQIYHYDFFPSRK